MQDKGAYLYEQFLSGDNTALEDIVKAYSDNLIRFAYLYVKDSAAAEDIAEEAIATLIFKRKKFDKAAKFKTYLFTVVKNKCVDYLRKKRRCVPLEDLKNVLHGGNFEESAIKRDEYVKLYTALNLLPQQYNQVLHLSYFEEFEVGQICKILQKSEKQVYNLLARAKASLKKLLIDMGFDYEKL